MPNMSYCRFQNTLTDLQDCTNHLDDIIKDEEREDTNPERLARIALIELCCDIAVEYGEEVGRDITDGEI